MTPVREALEAKVERLRKNHFAGMEVMRSFALEIIEALSAAPGEPCAWGRVIDGKAVTVSLTKTGANDQPLYTTPQPAAGWDEAINAAMATIEKMRVAGACNFSDARHQGQRGADYLDTLYDACQAVKALRREAPAPAEGVKPSSIATCCVTGAIPGDGGACGDCDPCIMGEASVPEPVKRLVAEKNSLLQRIGELEDAAAARPDTAEALPRWRHKTRGTIYTEIGRGFAQVSHHPIEEMTAVVIYRGSNGCWWVRNAVEFDDGRFEVLSPPSGGDEAKESEGGEPDVERTQRRLAVSDDGLGPMQAIPREPPSGPSEPSPPADRREIVARECADELVRIVEAAERVTQRTGNTFVLDRQRIAKMIAGRFAALDGGR